MTKNIKALLVIILVFGTIYLSAEDVFQLVNDDDLEKLETILSKDHTLLNKPDRWGFSLLHRSAMKGQEIIFRHLLKIGAEINIKDFFR